ncbi:MAG: fibrobacter succinogenes major paralogous domain-containing protein, partial [Chitinispirillia bacterium]|nr:fibrobacter succinogenes major paralogous domain-containing protein [Chitinispirillia bacterium]MCL2242603.1 fibrobacter succinogenes major paralogous domain-containing protein [Chitinispirillia bacterium]
NYGSLTDTRDGKTYRTVVIGSQTWMAENLNYNASGSVCYSKQESNCNTYGRLYNWATVMNVASSSISSPSGVRGVCPEGWHVPSDAEWEILVKYVDSNAPGNYDNNAGTKLRSKSGWYNNVNGTDDYGFSALPGGYGGTGGNFFSAGYYGVWWSATEFDAADAWYWDMSYINGYVDRGNSYKAHLLSVRCVRDSAAPQ